MLFIVNLSYYLFYDKNYDTMDAKLLQGLQGKPKSIKPMKII